MELTVNGKKAHAATGGTDASDGAPVLVLIHGAGMDGTVWQLQSRYLAHRGIRVLALDLPGHGHSAGDALATVVDMADWVAVFMDAAGVGHAAVAGHSMGALVTLELAARHPEKVRSVGLLGAAAEMPVHPDLIAAAEAGGRLAPELITDWGFGTIAHTGGHLHPGLWAMGAAERLLMDARPGVLASDLKACDAYKDALAAAAKVEASAALISGDEDKMTPLKNAGRLLETLADVTPTVLERTGHMMMIERPREVAKLLLDLAR
ncbi:MAG: alpha/beta fold hydrolase [Rhodospirillales bacterium]